MIAMILSALCLAAIGVAQEKPVSLRLKATKQFPPPQPARENGDQVDFDANTGVITATSRGKSFVFRKKNLIGPVLRVAYAESAGQIAYEYFLSNAPGSQQAIGSFVLYVPSPSLVAVTAPAPWTAIPNSNPAPPQTPALLLLPVKPDTDKANSLSAGKLVGPILLKAPALPGLIRVVFRPEFELVKPGEFNEGDFFNWASPWTRERILEFDSPDRREIRSWTIGPATDSTSDSVAAVQAELNAGAQVPEFTPILGDLRAAAALASPGAIMQRLARIEKTPLQQQYLAAIRWRLARLH